MNSWLGAAAFWAVFLCAGSAFAYSAEVENIPSDRYFEVTLNEIQQAQSSIRLTMYLVDLPPGEPGSKAYQLADALAQAKQRGVDVRVVLDQDIRWREEPKNEEAYRYLREQGVQVFFDEKKTRTHAKVLVIDGKTVILGSTNWSKAALTRNVEANVLIRSRELAGELLAGFEKLPVQAPAAEKTKTVAVPRAFLNDPKLLGRMVNDRDRRYFDGYLYLLKEDGGAPDYQELLEELRIPQETSKKNRYRDALAWTLKRLQGKYGLIRYSMETGKGPVISLRPAREPDETVAIPVTYWEWGWSRKLSFSGKVMWLLSQMYSLDSPTTPRWHQSEAAIAKRHGISRHFVSRGLRELRRLNLIEVKMGALNSADYSKRDANVYTPNPLYDPVELEGAFKKLEGQYGKEAVKKAAGYAALVYEGSDAEAVERLIVLEKEFGARVVERAVRKVDAMSGNNPKRTAAYLIRTIQGMGNERTGNSR